MSSETTDVASTWFEFLGWVETNKKQLLLGLAAGIGLVFLVATVRWNGDRKERAANDALLRLRPTATEPGTTPPPTPASDYLKVAQAHAGTSAGHRAVLLAAGALFQEGQYAEAQTQFDRFLKADPSGAFAPVAALGIASSLESLGKWDEARTAYELFGTRYAKSSLSQSAQLGLARLLEAKGQADLALKILDDVIRANGAGRDASQIEALRKQLIGRNPALGSTAALPAVTPGAQAGVTNFIQVKP